LKVVGGCLLIGLVIAWLSGPVTTNVVLLVLGLWFGYAATKRVVE